MFFSCILAATYTAFLAVAQAEDKLVTLPDGTQLRGLTSNSVTSFKGIPFATPPVGDLRWAPPHPWVNPDTSVVLDGSEFGNICKQTRDGEVKGNEDCLFLNVYVHMNSTMEKAEHPVGFYIHGGSYMNGAGSDYDGTDFINFWDGNAVVVSINYRLNVFGFSGSELLRSQDPKGASTANYGIQDQRLAMKWVHDNIASFGGAKEQVMIYGESAGAGSISNHLAMERSWGYFSSATLESGSFSEWVTQPMSLAQTAFDKLAAAIDCVADDLACMLGKGAEDVYAASLDGMTPEDPNWGTPYNPTVDGSELSTHPWVKLYNGQVADVPVMHGTNRDEGSMFYPLPTTVSEAGLLAYWDSFGIYDEKDLAYLDALYIKDQTYPEVPVEDGEPQPTPYWWGGMRWLGDVAFSCPAKYSSQQLSRLQSTFTRRSGSFTYHFEYHANSSSVPYVQHTAEIPFIFHMHKYVDDSVEDYEMANVMSSYWGNFLAMHDPNNIQASPLTRGTTKAKQLSASGKSGQYPYGSPVPVSSWPEYNAAADMLQDIRSASDVHPEAGLKKEECNFINRYINTDIRMKFPVV